MPRYLDPDYEQANYERESRLERDRDREPSQPARYLSREDYLERARIALDRAFVRADHPDYDTTAERDMDVKP